MNQFRENLWIDGRADGREIGQTYFMEKQQLSPKKYSSNSISNTTKYTATPC